jgi:molecular chaperone HtpG
MSNSLTTVRTAGVDLGGLMTVLGQHLYSTPMVALRELVQNAHDSIVRRQIEDPHAVEGASIRVEGDALAGVVRVIDTGAGLTADEVHRYLATVGVGYTRKLREETHSDQLIGMFGLGFLSAFVLAKRVTVTTTSFQNPALGWRYQSSNGEQYTLTEVPARAVGTVVELELRDIHNTLSATGVLTKILKRYCALLRVPVMVGAGATEALNGEPPPWRSAVARPEGEGKVLEHAIQARRQALAFAHRFEAHFEPLCTLPVVCSSMPDLQGLLWVQDGSTYGTSDNRNLSVFVRGMLLDDDARDLLPPWAGFIGGVIESSQLTPTASREDLQRDGAYRVVQEALTESLITGLADIAQHQTEAWRRVVARHNEALLGAALCDPRLFALLADAVHVPTSQGDLPARGLADKGVVHVNMGGVGGFEDMLFRALKVPVARGERYAVLPFLREWAQTHGTGLVELGTEQGNRKLFSPAELPSEDMAWLSEVLCDGERLVPAHFDPIELPLVVVHDRDAELKKQLESDEMDKRMSVAALRLVRSFTAELDGATHARLYLNVDNPAVQCLLGAHHANHPHASDAAGLLRALKVVMAGNEKSTGGGDLNQALGRVTQVLELLLG